MTLTRWISTPLLKLADGPMLDLSKRSNWHRLWIVPVAIAFALLIYLLCVAEGIVYSCAHLFCVLADCFCTTLFAQVEESKRKLVNAWRELN